MAMVGAVWSGPTARAIRRRQRSARRRAWNIQPAASLPAPAFVLKLLLGGKAELLLSSQRAVPNALKAAGFRFRYGELEKALADLVPASAGADQPTTNAST